MGRNLFPVIVMGSICECMPYREASLKSLKAAGGTCDKPCLGDETSTCGGSSSFDLYKILPTDAAEGVRAVRADAGGAVTVADDAHGERGSASKGVVIVDFQHDGCFLYDGYEGDDTDRHYDFFGNTPMVRSVMYMPYE